MSFVANFTASQGSDCSKLIITDTSDYSVETQDTFSSRYLYIYKVDGSLIDPHINNNIVTEDGIIITTEDGQAITTEQATYSSGFINFDFSTYPNNQITIPNIEVDYCLRIILVLTSINPQNGSIYTKTSVVTLTCYTNTFLYYVAQIAATNPYRINDPIFYNSWSHLQTEKDAAIIAGSYADQLSSDAALRRAENIINESNLRF
jgi:hypothetical protein